MVHLLDLLALLAAYDLYTSATKCNVLMEELDLLEGGFSFIKSFPGANLVSVWGQFSHFFVASASRLRRLAFK